MKKTKTTAKKPSLKKPSSKKCSPEKSCGEYITGKMTLSKVAQDYPAAIPILFSYGLHCIGCHVAAFESVEQGLAAHGLSENEIAKVIKEMNEAVIKLKKN